MLLTDIKFFLLKNKKATLEELSSAMRCDREMVKQAMRLWIDKKMVHEEKSGPTCPGCTCGCSSGHNSCAELIIYTWIA